jgi:hypothetical protein
MSDPQEVPEGEVYDIGERIPPPLGVLAGALPEPIFNANWLRVGCASSRGSPGPWCPRGDRARGAILHGDSI